MRAGGLGGQPVVLRIEHGEHVARLHVLADLGAALRDLAGDAEPQPRFDPGTHLTGELLAGLQRRYPDGDDFDRADRLGRGLGAGAAEQDEIKIGDLAAISRTRILVGERDSVEGGSHKKVYLVDLAGATDIAENDEINGKTIEQASEADLKRAGIDTVRKSMVVDLAKLGFSPDKFEGLALVDSTTIAVVNDNDFGVSAIDSRGRVVRGGSAPRLVVIRVPEPLQ